jgi:hypothetical protein
MNMMALRIMETNQPSQSEFKNLSETWSNLAQRLAIRTTSTVVLVMCFNLDPKAKKLAKFRFFFSLMLMPNFSKMFVCLRKYVAELIIFLATYFYLSLVDRKYL